MDNLQLILVAALVYYFLLREDKEGFITLTQSQRDIVKNYSLGPQPADQLQTLNIPNDTNKLIQPMLILIGLLNGIISPDPKAPGNQDPKQIEQISKLKEELKKQGIDIFSLRDKLTECVIALIESEPNLESYAKVITSTTFSSNLNSIFLELNKIDIAVLSSIFMTKDEFCKKVGATKEQQDEKFKNGMLFINQILAAYSNLIMVFYMFIVKNMNNVITYCGEENTTHLKEFKKMFETIRLAVITKEDIDNKCPRPVPEQVCASYISEASTCNTNLSSLKGQRTILIVLVVLLLIVLGYKFIA